MNSKAVLPSVLCLSVLVSSIFITPTASAGDCSDKELLSTKTVSLGYTSTYESPEKKAMIQTRLEKIVNMMNEEQVMRAQKAVMNIKDDVETNHPQYWVFETIEKLFENRLASLNTTQSIVDLAVGTPELSTLVEVVKALDLVDTLAGEGTFTVFAPTNAAFEALLAQLGLTFEELAANTDLLRTVVLYHVLDTKVLSTDVVALQEGTLVQTLGGELGGESLRTSSRDGVKIDNANVISADISASNGVVHVVDSVLLPPSVLESLSLPTDRGESDVATVAIESAQFPTLIAALEAANLVEALQAEGPFTVYAPTEEAFTELLNNLGVTTSELLANTELLTSVLTYHVVPGFYDSTDVLSIEGSIKSVTLNGKTVTVSNNSNGPMVNEANIINTDFYGTNGVIHVIDAVLLP